MIEIRIPLIVASLAGTLLMAGCGGSSGRAPSPPIIDPETPRTVTEVVMDEIDQNTSETAEPIELNDLPVEDDRSETGEPSQV